MLFGTAQSGSGTGTIPSRSQRSIVRLLGMESWEFTEQIRGIGDNPGDP